MTDQQTAQKLQPFLDEFNQIHNAMVRVVDVKDDTRQLLAYQELFLE
jgi:hypothetical protein